ncbi:hypothetical protein FSARC_1839 [Fusarium sarcochroum]|uniref:Uncharacterized protein n=1 Tax=Fusarium sarcochroum TaxID=1208366 RepID=A0A8H4XEK5_9HYPO|nr:hypothetical protein FSARC_1839 [Fusarium sarcochroum]
MWKLSKTCTSTCKDFPEEIPSYGDIGGIGVANIQEVTMAFAVTAWMVVLLLIAYYFTAFDPKLHPFRKENTQTPCSNPNAIDHTIHQLLHKVPGLGSVLKARSSRSLQFETMLNNCILMFADIQIFTALAILISGYISLGCEIVPYHWQYMIYLAWLASVTHLASLSFLRNHLSNNFGKCVWRLTAMCVIQILLAVAVGFAAHLDGEDWLHTDGGRPAICYFQEPINTGSDAFQSAIKIIILLVWGFAIRIAKIFPSFERGLRNMAAQLQEISRKRQHGDANITNTQEWDPRRGTGVGRVRILIQEPFVIAFYAVLSIQLDLFTSFLAEVYWLLFSITWITVKLIKLRVQGNQDDSKWAFGQTLPLILLLAPLATVLEQFLAKTNVTESQSTVSGSQRDPINAQGTVRNLGCTNNIAYRGVFLLAALSYIEIGVYFIRDQEETQGFVVPLVQLFFSMLLLNPLLQLLWVICDLWVSKMSWGNSLKMSAYDTFMVGFVSMSLAANFMSTEEIPGDIKMILKVWLMVPVPLIIGLMLFAYIFLVIIFWLVSRPRYVWFALSPCLIFVSYLLTRTLVYARYGYPDFGFPDFVLLGSIAGVSFLELVIYGLEVLAEKKAVVKHTVWLRCIMVALISPLCFILSRISRIIPPDLFLQFVVVSRDCNAIEAELRLDTGSVKWILAPFSSPTPFSAPAYPPPPS